MPHCLRGYALDIGDLMSAVSRQSIQFMIVLHRDPLIDEERDVIGAVKEGHGRVT